MPQKNAKFDAKFYVRAYEYAKAGESDAAIGKLLGVSAQTIKTWKAAKPAFKEAITRGRKQSSSDGMSQFKDYVYKRLPAELQELWSYLEDADHDDSSQIERMEAMLNDAGIRARQHLFINALISSNFNKGKALRFVNTSYRTLKQWITNDPQFGELLDAVHEAKKDAFESALCLAVKRGETAAVIFANETLNRDRGYGRKVQVQGEIEHKHQHDHTHKLVSWQDLNLPVDIQREILKALREHEKKDAIEGEVIHGGGTAQKRQLQLN